VIGLRRGVRIWLPGALLFAAAAVAIAAYPDHPIRLVVPVAAGGGNDIVARLLAQKLAEAWGQSVVVDNRPGAATAIGAEIVAKSIPDGYTILLTSVSRSTRA
jgi:tripartite-type tricarboxylate transporter receptor subunit TctC